MRNRALQHFIAIAAIATTGTAFAAADSSSSNADVSPAMGMSSEQSAIGNQSESAMASKLDLNKDGIISKKEVAANKDLAKQFDSLDANKDGKLEQAEFARFEMSQPLSPSSSPSLLPSSDQPATKP